MQEIRRKRAIAIGLRARLPLVIRVLALCVLVIGSIVAGISYYRMRHNKPFRMLGGKPELSKQVIGRVEGYERRVMEGDRVRLYMRAAVDVTYSDNHHEMEDILLEVYPETGDKPDKISSQRAIYIPDQVDPNQASVTFTGNVNMETRDGLTAKTDTINFDQKSEMAETASLVTFVRENVSGQATGAEIDSKNKRLELRSGVEIIVAPEVAKANGAKPNPRAGPVKIHSAHATFDQHSLQLVFTGGATAEQGSEIMSGDKLTATLNEKKRLNKVESRGNSYLRSMTEGRSAELHSVAMDFFLDDDQKLERAIANGDVRVRSLNAESEMQLTGASGLEANFQRQGDKSLLKEMKAAGRSIVTLSAPQSRANDSRAANKRLTADSIKLDWRVTGRDLESAEAVGNAELFIDPVQKTATADRKTLTAPRFDCDFFETGNLARTFTASSGAKAVIDPVMPTEERAVRNLTSEKMVAVFVRETQDIARFDATGDTKFDEKDRNGRGANGSYTADDETIRLRGGEPTVWDSRARIKATEIDMDTRSDVSNARGKTQTTYYSQEQTNGATPFSKVKSPVYITSDRAEFRHTTGVAVYTGNARAWQDDNFVRSDTLTLRRETKDMEGNGHVQSALYNVKRTDATGATSLPAFASSDRITYSESSRLLHYDGNVDIRQGTDRITSGVADVYLLKDSNDVEKTVAQRDVVLTQPGRKGTGQWGQYTNADETVVLTGSPARVEDAEKGTSEGARLTVHLRDNRVEADDPRGTQSPGRVRTVHKIKKQ